MSAGPVVTAGSSGTLRVTGVVQGVGFRPFVHRLATRHGVAGWVRNGSGEVEIRVEGPPEAVQAFQAALRSEAPVHAVVDAVAWTPATAEGLTGFIVLPSTSRADQRLPVAPDTATCAACRAELADPDDRRYRYPFITCTDCGPRFTVIEAMPYDRERTSMRAFLPCDACRTEYGSPGHRRFHSETNCCPVCGPRLWFEAGGATTDGTEPALAAAAELLRRGGILALRGLGGFHLAVDATHQAAVVRLRSRKHREAKPLAVMVRSLEEARRLGAVDDVAAALLSGPEHPLVLLPRRPEAPLAEAVAPGLAEVAVMLAYTPLHLLLLDALSVPLVMTSGNRSDEPIATGCDEARRRLDTIADGFLMHDRDIVARYDDSVVRVVDGAPVFLRRARGYAPLPVRLPVPAPRPLVAVGPHLKHTFCLAHGEHAWPSQHIGDLETVETLDHFRAALARLQGLLRIAPEVVVRDLHPGYLSTRVAGELGLEREIAVQHHHAHVAAVLAEHGETGPVLGLAFDGTGYGPDGTIWGGEVLWADLWSYRRVAHLRAMPLAGGDLGARTPWRSALAYAVLRDDGMPAPLGAAFSGVAEPTLRIAADQIRRGINAPPVSSMGRLFDAAAAVLGVRRESRYEAQAAMELEALAGAQAGPDLSWQVDWAADPVVLDPTPLIRALGRRLLRGDDPAGLAAGFHDSVSTVAVEAAVRLAGRLGLYSVVLSGGSFQNARLLRQVRRQLTRRGLRVLVPRRFSPNDGAISLGQAAVAAALLEHR